MEPLKLKAPLKDYLWGGHRLKQEYGKETDLEKVAESWELSCHKDGMSVIADGPCAGLTLPEYAGRYGKSVFGSHCAPFRDFPMLIKLIDAEQNLSVQVHPDNDYALREEGEYGKTEMWVVVDAREGASLIYGVNRTHGRNSLPGFRITRCSRCATMFPFIPATSFSSRRARSTPSAPAS